MKHPGDLQPTRRTTTPILAIVVTLSMAVAASGGKGGGKKPPPQPETGVAYWVTWLGTLGGEDSFAYAMNNAGVVVGKAELSSGASRAFRVVPEVDQNGDLVYHRDDDSNGLNDLLKDLNDLGVWIDHTGAPVPNCTAVSAEDVNVHSEIVGTAQIDDTGETRVFTYDPARAELILLPPPTELLNTGADFFGSAINDAGDTVGYGVFPDGTSTAIFYRWSPELTGFDLGVPASVGASSPRRVDLNNRGPLGAVHIVTKGGFLLTLHADLLVDPAQDLEFFDRLEIYAINDQATFCGRQVAGDAKGRWKDPGGSFRYSDQLEILLEGGSNRGREINFEGDVIVQRGWIHHDLFGISLLEDLVVNPPQWGPGNERFNPFGMTDRGETGFPMICGRGVLDGYKAWVLIPVFVTQ